MPNSLWDLCTGNRGRREGFLWNTGGVRRNFTLRTQKYTWAWNFARKKIPGIKNTRFSTSILIYSIKKTLRPEIICDRSLDQKNYQGWTFSSPKNTLDLPVIYTTSTTPPPPQRYSAWHHFPYFSCSTEDIYNDSLYTRPKEGIGHCWFVCNYFGHPFLCMNKNNRVNNAAVVFLTHRPTILCVWDRVTYASQENERRRREPLLPQKIFIF